jgi:putative flippase GtrA
MVGEVDRHIHSLRTVDLEASDPVSAPSTSTQVGLAGCLRDEARAGAYVSGTRPRSERNWLDRLWSRNAAVLLGRNTLVSVAVLCIGLVLLWLLVEFGHVDKVIATGLTFLVATSLHYSLGRTWIYQGTSRKIIPGYAFFIANALTGLAITLVLFAALIRYTSVNYLVARIIVSLLAGLAMFLLNAGLNFRRL